MEGWGRKTSSLDSHSSVSATRGLVVVRGGVAWRSRWRSGATRRNVNTRALEHPRNPSCGEVPNQKRARIKI